MEMPNCAFAGKRIGSMSYSMAVAKVAGIYANNCYSVDFVCKT